MSIKTILFLSLFVWVNAIGQPVMTTQHGKASWYSSVGDRHNPAGRTTASGEKLRDSSNTAAHKTLPFGTLVKVINLNNGKSEIVKINNRGPYIRGRIIDVTVGVARKLGFLKQGVTSVKIEVLQKTN